MFGLLRRHPARAFTLLALGVAHPGSAAGGAPVVVEASGRTACPQVMDLEEALEAQLRGVPRRSGGGWRLLVRRIEGNAHGARRARLRLELRDHQERPRLQRELEVGNADCRALADAVALIVHRFFAELGWTAGGPPPPVQRRSPAASPAAGPVSRRAVVLEAGAGVWTRRPGVGTGLLGLRLEWRHLEASLGLLAPGASITQRRPDGEASMTAWGMALSVGLGWQRGSIRLQGGPMSLVCREWARTRGIPVVEESSGTTWALGLAAGASLRPGRGWRLGLQGWGARAAFGDRFVVAGWGPVLAPPRLQAAVLGSVAYDLTHAFSP